MADAGSAFAEVLVVLVPEDSEQDKKDRDALLAAFALLLMQSLEQMQKDVLAYSAGTLSLAQLTDALTAVLFNGHADATMLGRQLAGIDGALDQFDKDFAATIMAEQSPFLQGLIADIAEGRYSTDGKLVIEGALLNRLKMYVRVMRATATEAWALAQTPQTLIEWRLGPTENCEDCLQMASGSPYPARSLHQFPGDGQTQCLSNCACVLAAARGQSAFEFVDI